MDDREAGPFNAEEVAAMVEAGEVSVATLARKNQSVDWDGLENYMPEIHRANNWKKDAENVLAQVHKDAQFLPPTVEAPNTRKFSSDIGPTGLRAIGIFVMLIGFMGVGIACTGLPVFVEGSLNQERLNLRLCLVIAGSVVFLTGVIMMATAYIVGHMQNLKR